MSCICEQVWYKVYGWTLPERVGTGIRVLWSFLGTPYPHTVCPHMQRRQEGEWTTSTSSCYCRETEYGHVRSGKARCTHGRSCEE